MEYKIFLSSDAKADLKALDPLIAKRILKKIFWYQKQPNIFSQVRFLRDTTSGDIRFRIGDYRAIGVVDTQKKQITIVAIGPLREIYLR